MPKAEKRPFPSLSRLISVGPGRLTRFDEDRVVYALVSDDDEVLYIGYTTNLVNRLKSHLERSHSAGIREWVAAGKPIRAVVLDRVSKSTWEQRERKWIGRARRLGSLFNIQAGGSYHKGEDGRLVALPPRKTLAKPPPRSGPRPKRFTALEWHRYKRGEDVPSVTGEWTQSRKKKPKRPHR
jgi:predicted GIY-YIG superfamily endonuclease